MPARLNLPLDEIRERTARGQKIDEIAVALGCNRSTLWRRMKKEGLPRLPQKARREKNYFWNGGRVIDKSGYVLLSAPDHPNRDRHGYVREHRLVMEAQLGRYLSRLEVVDHIDGNTSNNDPANLRVFPSNAAHLAATLRERVPAWSAEGKARIQQSVRQPRGTRRTPILDPSGSDDPPSL